MRLHAALALFTPINASPRHWLTAFALVALSPTPIVAAPWTDSNDRQLRHHIQYLADTGVLSAPITTWPVMWASLIGDVLRAEQTDLSSAQRWSLGYVRFAFEQQAAPGARTTLRLHGQSALDPQQGYGAVAREQVSVDAGIDWVGDGTAAQLRAQWIDDPTDGKQLRYDGSYVAALVGNWSLSIGAIDRWWGPGWEDSLILSNSARPVLGGAISRNQAHAFETPWLSWIGPWQVTATGGQLESNRHVPNAYLLGLRVSIKPWQPLELGFSRSAQWGGDDRPQDWDSLTDLILGNDNTGTLDEPGNQLGGFDARLSFTTGMLSNALYAQFIGEDESGATPSRGIILAGMETAWAGARIHHRLRLEAYDSTSEFYSDARPNYAYEHFIYQSGYRHRGRPIGAALDNDSRSFRISGSHYFADGDGLEWTLGRIQHNRDGSDQPAPGGNAYGATRTDIDYLRLGYLLPLANQWQFSVGGFYYSDSLALGSEKIDSGGYATLEFRL